MKVFNFFQSLFRKKTPDDNAIEMAQRFASIAVRFIFTLRVAGLDGEKWVRKEPLFVAGYLQGFADVIAQHLGGSSGGDLSANIALQFVKVILSDADADNEFVNSFIEFAVFQASGEQFNLALALGGSDGNEMLQSEYNILSRGLEAHFSS
jgi:hypothetical protein